ncbi:MAG: TIGR04086 family membrane protein [Faecalibacterium sp.]
MAERMRVPAGPGRFLLAFGMGLGVCAASLAALAWLMAERSLSTSLSGPMATAAVCLGCLSAGWLASFWQKHRGLLCGAAQGVLFSGALAAVSILQGVAPDGAQLLRMGLAVLAGCAGGILGMLCAEGRRR